MNNLIKSIIKEELGISLPIKLSGSFTLPDDVPNKGDALHSFDRRRSDKFGGYMLRGEPIPSQWKQYVKLDQGKGVNQVLRELKRKGIKGDVTDFNIKVNDDYSVDWDATIDESKDGKGYVRMFTRGSAGGGADNRAQGQISGLKSKNSEYCNWTEVLDLNITKPIKIRQFFFKATKCKEGEEPNDETIEKENELEEFFKDWESGMYNIEGDEEWEYKLNDDKEWEAKKGGGSFLTLKDSLSDDDYDEALNNLKDAKLVTTERRYVIKKVLREETNLKTKLMGMINKIGWEKASLAVGGTKKLAEIAFDGNPYEFLDRFNNLRIERDEESDDISFIDRNGKRLIYIDASVKTVFFDHDEIWKFIEKGFENYILYPNQILYQWFKKTYGIGQFGVMYAHWLNYRR
jgi:hypothetical protein